MGSLCISTFFVIALCLISVNSRRVVFKNQCSFSIDVEGTPGGILCNNLGVGASCSWTIPPQGYIGNIHRRNREGNNLGYPSATLAEFNFGNQNAPGQWNWDWFDISIIPPGCPESIRSHEGCWCNGGSDGYDVGMTITPLKCQGKKRTCLNKKCDGAYGYPKDDTKTTVCQDLSGDWEVVFCPPGSLTDLGSTVTDQTPPCRRGGSNPTPKPSNPPSRPPSNPPANPPTGSSSACVFDPDIDYWGSDLSNKRVGSRQECCAYCRSLPACNAWTYAAGVCYAKTGPGNNRRKAAGVWSGTILGARAEGDNAVTAPTETKTASQSNSAAIIIGCVTAGFAVLLVVAVVVIARGGKGREEKV